MFCLFCCLQVANKCYYCSFNMLYLPQANHTLSSGKNTLMKNETTQFNVSQTTTIPTSPLDTDDPPPPHHHHNGPHHHHHQHDHTSPENLSKHQHSQNNTLHPPHHHPEHHHHHPHYHDHHHQHHHQQPGNHSHHDEIEEDDQDAILRVFYFIFSQYFTFDNMFYFGGRTAVPLAVESVLAVIRFWFLCQHVHTQVLCVYDVANASLSSPINEIYGVKPACRELQTEVCGEIGCADGYLFQATQSQRMLGTAIEQISV